MKFDTPATTSAIDQLNVVGQAMPRIDGRLKTTGTAPYAYERQDVAPGQAYGYVVGAAIAKGRIKSMSLDAALRAPGVLGIVSALDHKPVPRGYGNAAKLFGGPEIEHYHQAIALVVGETFEQARAAAGLVVVDYERAAGKFDLSEAAADAVTAMNPDGKSSAKTYGDFDSAFAAAPVALDEVYSTPGETHAMMEPYATIASWNGDHVTVWTSSQLIQLNKYSLMTGLGLPADKVRVDSPYVGGGFGGKLFLQTDAILAALGARQVGRPVKVALPRPLIANNTTHRPATIQRIRLGAGRDGKLTAIAHESTSGNLPGGPPETAVMQTELLYAGANRKVALQLATLDLPEGGSMRAPGEAPGLMALEIAMDELAEKLKMDPVKLRIINDTQVDPMNPTRPFSHRNLVGCLERGAKEFRWNERNPKPGANRQGRFLIGHGVAAGIRNNILIKSGARARLAGNGILTVETDMTDIGTGTYTIIAQTAAETMGLPIERVCVVLGDSSFPAACGSGGQMGATNSTAGVYAACMKLREEIIRALGINGPDIVFAKGGVSAGGRTTPLAEAATNGDLVAEDAIEYGDIAQQRQQSTFAAHFVEVAVDRYTAETHVRRMLAVCSAGRILNPMLARNQVIGGMTMGVGAALSEELAVDTRFGFFVNHDLAGYEVPVHADIPHQQVIFLNETDPWSTPMKAKGVGELGLCGVAAAVANAVYNATGIRIRDYPLTLDKYLERLPQVA